MEYHILSALESVINIYSINFNAMSDTFKDRKEYDFESNKNKKKVVKKERKLKNKKSWQQFSSF